MSAKYPLGFRAAILEENNKPLVLKEIEFPGPLQPGQVVVKLLYSGVCGKQIEEIDGTGGPDAYLPHLLGHEGSGRVVDVGPGVTKVKIDDVVVLHWMKGSGIQAASPLYYYQGKRINAGWVTTFNEYAVVSENRLTSLEANADPIVAALLGCMGTTGAGVIINEANVQPYDTVVIYGCGGIGLCAIQAARMRHPQCLIAVDVNDRALALAKEYGADEVINSTKTDPIKAVKDLTKGKGASKVIITVGNAKAIETAINTSSIPGECIMVGNSPKGASIPIDAFSIMNKRIVRGTQGGNIVPERDIPAYYRLFRDGILPLDKLVAYTGEFTKINEAIDVMRSATPGRCVVRF